MTQKERDIFQPLLWLRLNRVAKPTTNGEQFQIRPVWANVFNGNK